MDDKVQIQLFDQMEKLGFTHEELTTYGAQAFIDSAIQVTAYISIEATSALPEYLGLLFTFQKQEEQPPILQTVRASFLKKESYDSLKTLIEKTYSVENGELPTKAQIYKDLTQALNIKKNQDHDILANEFSLLGFDFEDIMKNDINDIDEKHSQMLGLFYLDYLPAQADGTAISFMIKNSENGKPPHIESMSATLFTGIYSGKFQEIVKKEYSSDEEKLPTKQQICDELISLSSIAGEIYQKLNCEFTQLGFEFKNFLNTIQMADSNFFFFKDEISDPAKFGPGNKLILEFEINKSIANNQYYYIDSMNARLLEKVEPSSNDILRRSWSPYEEYLPTKNKAIREMTALLELREARNNAKRKISRQKHSLDQLPEVTKRIMNGIQNDQVKGKQQRPKG
jgi:hypothetical protein